MGERLSRPTRYDRLINYRLLPINDFFRDHVRQVRSLLDIPPQGISLDELGGPVGELYYYTIAAFALRRHDEAGQKDYRRGLESLATMLDYPFMPNLIYEDAKMEFECIPNPPEDHEELIKWLAEEENRLGVESVWDSGPSAKELATLATLKDLGWWSIPLMVKTPWLRRVLLEDTESWWVDREDIPEWLTASVLRDGTKTRRYLTNTLAIDYCTYMLLHTFELPSAAFAAVRKYVLRGETQGKNPLTSDCQFLTMNVKMIGTECGPEFQATVNGIDEFTTKRQWLELWRQIQLHQATDLREDRFKTIFRRLHPKDERALADVVRKTLLIRRPGMNLERDIQWYLWSRKEDQSPEDIAQRWDEDKDRPCHYDASTVIKAVARLEERMKPKY